MEKNKRKITIIVLIAFVIIATMIVIFTGKPSNLNTSTQEAIPITEEQTEIVNKDGEVEVVDKDSKAAQEYESAVQSGDRDSVKTVKKSTTTTTKDTTKNNGSTTSNNSNKDTSNKDTNKPTTSDKPSTPAHTHSWTAVYKEVDKGHYETVTKTQTYTKCHICGADITNNVRPHMEAHLDNDEVGSYGTATRPYEEKVWVPNIVKVVDYYKCSCGATK